MTPSSTYRRTPLPPSARGERVLFVLGWISLVFSPFIGFAIDGRVSERGLAIGVRIAAVPLAVLGVLAMRRWNAWRQLPAHVAEEWRSGRVIPAAGAPAIAGPVRLEEGRNWIEIRSSGVALSPRAVMRSVAPSIHGEEQRDDVYLPWAAVKEWTVESDSEGPDYYRITLREGGHVFVRRFLASADAENKLLDAVRSIGRVAVRLRCDVG